MKRVRIEYSDGHYWAVEYRDGHAKAGLAATEISDEDWQEYQEHCEACRHWQGWLCGLDNIQYERDEAAKEN